MEDRENRAAPYARLSNNRLIVNRLHARAVAR
jgi:hypothetical protein